MFLFNGKWPWQSKNEEEEEESTQNGRGHIYSLPKNVDIPNSLALASHHHIHHPQYMQHRPSSMVYPTLESPHSLYGYYRNSWSPTEESAMCPVVPVDMAFVGKRKSSSIGGVVLWSSMLLVLLGIAAVVAVAAYLAVSTSNIDVAKYDIVYEGSIRVSSGDRYMPSMSDHRTQAYQKASSKYLEMLKTAYESSPLSRPFRLASVLNFVNASQGFEVHFDLRFDRRKIPSHVLDTERAVKDVLIQEAMSMSPLAFKDVSIDVDSLRLTQRFERSHAEKNSMIDHNFIEEEHSVELITEAPHQSTLMSKTPLITSTTRKEYTTTTRVPSSQPDTYSQPEIIETNNNNNDNDGWKPVDESKFRKPQVVPSEVIITSHNNNKQSKVKLPETVVTSNNVFYVLDSGSPADDKKGGHGEATPVHSVLGAGFPSRINTENGHYVDIITKMDRFGLAAKQDDSVSDEESVSSSSSEMKSIMDEKSENTSSSEMLEDHMEEKELREETEIDIDSIQNDSETSNEEADVNTDNSSQTMLNVDVGLASSAENVSQEITKPASQKDYVDDTDVKSTELHVEPPPVPSEEPTIVIKHVMEQLLHETSTSTTQKPTIIITPAVVTVTPVTETPVKSYSGIGQPLRMKPEPVVVNRTWIRNITGFSQDQYHKTNRINNRQPKLIVYTKKPPTVKTEIPTTTESVPETTTVLPIEDWDTTKISVQASLSETRQEPANKFECQWSNQFKCVNVDQCVNVFARCNLMRDCADGSDEEKCTCADYLRAQLLTRKICDGVHDCADFSDENECEWCRPGQFICPGNRTCIDTNRVCDGIKDCPSGDDEAECVKVSPDIRSASDLKYHSSGYLMVRRQGLWGKLCLENFDSVVRSSRTRWQIPDLGRAVCKALTFKDFESVKRLVDDDAENSHYYELFYSSESENSGGATPRTSLTFNPTRCSSKDVVRVSCKDLQCGTSPRATTHSAKIVGGSNANAGSWPWQVALYKEGEFQCGGALVGDRWVVSAGHCFYHSQDDYWVARMGALRRGSAHLAWSPFEQIRRVSRIFLHPDYIDAGFVNDLSLLRLAEPVEFTDYVRPICLPSPKLVSSDPVAPAEEFKDGTMCTVIGWGQLFETGRIFPDTLQEVQLPLISTEECRKRTLFLPLYRLTDNMFCAGYDRGGRDACLGDSGGPLMCQLNERWYLYGVTSNGYGCARANRPGVYTKVASYMPWIEDTMSKAYVDAEPRRRFEVSPDRHIPKCSGVRCLLGECLPANRRCDGITDCHDGRDEIGCNKLETV